MRRSTITYESFATLDGRIGTSRLLHRPHRTVKMAMLILAFASFLSQFGPTAQALPLKKTAMTNFNPSVEGFHFANTFTNDLFPKALSHTGLSRNLVETDGLCGGMVYAALDYYYGHKPIPNLNYRPATGTKLAHYIYQREVHSIEKNLTEWINMRVKPGGSRVHLFRRGLNGTQGGPLARLTDYINQGRPVVLDLKGVKNKSGDHQVLAIGYDLGRYRGDFGPHESDVKIEIYNPNDPDNTDTLIPDPAQHVWKVPQTGGTFRGFFVDTAYKPKTPPNLYYPVYPHDGLIHELILIFQPGDKVLYGGRADLNLEIDLVNGSKPLRYPNINLSARWLPNYTEYARVVLRRPLRRQEIRKLVLTDTFRSGINHDKWRMRWVEVQGLENNKRIDLASAGPKFFTIRDKRLEVPITTAQASGDQISRIVLTMPAKPGMNSDKWNMSFVQVFGKGIGSPRELASYGFNRFTPKKSSLVISLGSS